MPQWNRDRAADIASGRDERWIADCSRAIAAQLLAYDHHVAIVAGRAAVLITYPWQALPLSEQAEPLRLQASFAQPAGHPAAPATVQALVDRLSFRRWDGSEISPG